MSHHDHIPTVRASFEAYVTKDRVLLEGLLAEDFHFTSPLDNRLDRKTYFERCWPHSTRLSEFEFINLVQERDRVFVTYEARNTDGTRFRNTEVFTLRGEQIVNVEVYFGWSLPHPAPSGSFIEQRKG